MYSQVNDASTMALFGEIGGWHYAMDDTNPWKESTFWHKPGTPMYSFSFVDGHASNMTINGGMGINSKSNKLNFINF